MSFGEILERKLLALMQQQRMFALKQFADPIQKHDSVFGAAVPADEDGLPLVAPHQDVLIRIGYTTRVQPEVIQYLSARTTAQLGTEQQRADLRAVFEIGLRIAGGNLVTMEIGIERHITLVGEARPAPVLRVVRHT